ncbi:phage tail protein [Metapseudomonas otitidis]|uniref:phage tail protein n=1 Tax=Metapseudomonas otitidis TaxID=319939 RepID=UPI00244A35DF|nr:phage tail protein [Pseudomonas otitidis]MDH0335198.1 phage tail protein [Pseudomonas otitidis]
MTVRIPNGSTFDLASAYGSPITISGISNANPAVVTATGHGLANGDFIELKTGWSKLNERVFRVAGVTTNTFELEGVNSTSTSDYPASGGAGTCREITSWARLIDVLETASSGGEQQYYPYGTLESNEESQIPTTRSPFTLTITVSDDTTPAYVAVAEAADQDRQKRALRLNLPTGSIILYNGFVSFSETPSLTRNQAMTRTMSFAQDKRLVRYSA